MSLSVESVLSIAALVVGAATTVFAYMAWRAAAPSTQWEVHRMDVGSYKIVRTGIRSARVVSLHVSHEGPPGGVGHASGQIEPILFKRGRSVHFTYSYTPGPLDAVVPLEMRGREIDVTWRAARYRRNQHKGRFVDHGREQVTLITLD